MKTKNHKSKNNLVSGIFVAIAGIACGLWLLISLDKITGAEFVALSLGFAVIGLIIAFAAEVQEFSIAGNGVKLKELRSEAERTIEDLKQARTELFRLMLPQVLEGSQTTLKMVDPRIKAFLKLYEQVEKFNCIAELKIDISKTLNVLMVGQFNKLGIIHKNTKSVGDIFESREKPDLLYIELKDEMINQIIERKSPRQEFEDVKKDVIEGIEAYAKLYAIKVKLDKLEN